MKKKFNWSLLLSLIFGITSVSLSFLFSFEAGRRLSAENQLKALRQTIGQTETEIYNKVVDMSNILDTIAEQNTEQSKAIEKITIKIQENESAEEPEIEVAEFNKKCIVPDEPTNWFTCEPMDMITNTRSDQYLLQQVCSTEESTGIRYFTHNGNNYYTVALAANYGRDIGDTWLVELDNGESFYIMLGDYKDDGSNPDRLGDPATNYEGNCLNVIEFIVEREEVPRGIWLYGSQSRHDRFDGNIITMEHLGLVDWSGDCG